eukprot:66167_1
MAPFIFFVIGIFTLSSRCNSCGCCPNCFGRRKPNRTQRAIRAWSKDVDPLYENRFADILNSSTSDVASSSSDNTDDDDVVARNAHTVFNHSFTEQKSFIILGRFLFDVVKQTSRDLVYIQINYLNQWNATKQSQIASIFRNRKALNSIRKKVKRWMGRFDLLCSKRLLELLQGQREDIARMTFCRKHDPDTQFKFNILDRTYGLLVHTFYGLPMQKTPIFMIMHLGNEIAHYLLSQMDHQDTLKLQITKPRGFIKVQQPYPFIETLFLLHQLLHALNSIRVLEISSCFIDTVHKSFGATISQQNHSSIVTKHITSILETMEVLKYETNVFKCAHGNQWRIRFSNTSFQPQLDSQRTTNVTYIAVKNASVILAKYSAFYDDLAREKGLHLSRSLSDNNLKYEAHTFNTSYMDGDDRNFAPFQLHMMLRGAVKYLLEVKQQMLGIQTQKDCSEQIEIITQLCKYTKTLCKQSEIVNNTLYNAEMIKEIQAKAGIIRNTQRYFIKRLAQRKLTDTIVKILPSSDSFLLRRLDKKDVVNNQTWHDKVNVVIMRLQICYGHYAHVAMILKNKRVSFKQEKIARFQNGFVSKAFAQFFRQDVGINIHGSASVISYPGISNLYFPAYFFHQFMTVFRCICRHLFATIIDLNFKFAEMSQDKDDIIYEFEMRSNGELVDLDMIQNMANSAEDAYNQIDMNAIRSMKWGNDFSGILNMAHELNGVCGIRKIGNYTTHDLNYRSRINKAYFCRLSLRKFNPGWDFSRWFSTHANVQEKDIVFF